MVQPVTGEEPQVSLNSSDIVPILVHSANAARRISRNLRLSQKERIGEFVTQIRRRILDKYSNISKSEAFVRYEKTKWLSLTETSLWDDILMVTFTKRYTPRGSLSRGEVQRVVEIAKASPHNQEEELFFEMRNCTDDVSEAGATLRSLADDLSKLSQDLARTNAILTNKKEAARV